MTLGTPTKNDGRNLHIKPVDFAKLERQLFDVIGVLDSNDIPYHLEGGTLLGIVREKRLLPWDHDTDISIMKQDLDRFLKVLPQIKTLGWTISQRTFLKEQTFAQAGEIGLIKVKDKKFLIIKGHHCLDIFVKVPHGDRVYWQAAGNIMSVSQSYYDGYDEIEWGGRTLKVPKRYRDYLTEKYGDWSVAVKDWHCDMEKTIAIPK